MAMAMGIITPDLAVPLYSSLKQISELLQDKRYIKTTKPKSLFGWF